MTRVRHALGLWMALVAALGVVPTVATAAGTADGEPDCFLTSLRVCVFHDDRATALVALIVFSGSLDEADDARGVAHYLEHLHLFGREGHDAPVAAQDGFAAPIDAFGNGFTTHFVTVYYWTVPRERAREALRRAVGIVQPRKPWSEEMADQERAIVARERETRLRDEGDRLASDSLARLYKGLSLAPPVIGSAEDVASLSEADALAFHEAHYRHDNAIVVATGLTRQEVETELAPARDERFELPERPPIELTGGHRPDQHLTRTDAGAGASSRRDRSLYAHPTTPRDRAAIHVIDAFLASRLPGSPYRPLVRERDAVREIDADLYIVASGLMSLDVWIGLRPDRGVTALDAETDALRRYIAMLSEGLPDETVARLTRRTAREVRAARRLPQQAAWSLIRWLRDGGTVADWRAYPDTVASITADETNALLRHLPTPRRRVIGDLLQPSTE